MFFQYLRSIDYYRTIYTIGLELFVYPGIKYVDFYQRQINLCHQQTILIYVSQGIVQYHLPYSTEYTRLPK